MNKANLSLPYKSCLHVWHLSQMHVTGEQGPPGPQGNIYRPGTCIQHTTYTLYSLIATEALESRNWCVIHDIDVLYMILISMHTETCFGHTCDLTQFHCHHQCRHII